MCHEFTGKRGALERRDTEGCHPERTNPARLSYDWRAGFGGEDDPGATGVPSADRPPEAIPRPEKRGPSLDTDYPCNKLG